MQLRQRRARTGPTSALGRDVVRITEWANKTDTGDRDELLPGVSERAWSQVAVSSRECLGATNCPYGADCFAESARMRAMRADVVVTNHALLAIDALSDVDVLPEHDVVVIDEAHELVDRVTGVATEELTSGIVERAAARCHRLAADESAQLTEAAAALSDVLTATHSVGCRRCRHSLVEVISLVRDAARLTTAAMARSEAGSNISAKTDADVEVVRRQARVAVEAVFDTAERLLKDSDDDVIWTASEERRGVVLRVAPLQVAQLLRKALFDQRTVVMTSATLTLGGRFEPVADGLGPDTVLRRQRMDGRPTGSMSGRRSITAGREFSMWQSIFRLRAATESPRWNDRRTRRTHRGCRRSHPRIVLLDARRGRGRRGDALATRRPDSLSG